MSTTEKTHTFMGMNITGDIDRGRDLKPQRPADELAILFQLVFENDLIEAVRWHQYTPYFNDGDPCVFSASGDSLAIKIKGRTLTEEEAEEQGEGDYLREDDVMEGWIETYSYGDDYPMVTLIGKARYPEGKSRWSQDVEPTWEGPHPQVARAVNNLMGAIGSGEFDHALQELFGDHAIVTVPSSGDIVIETYDHD